MGRYPKNVDEFLFGEQLSQEGLDIIDAHLSDKIDKFLDAKNNLVFDEEERLRPIDRKRIILGLAMRFTNNEIIGMVNQYRSEENLPPVSIGHTAYYRKKYGDIIDEIYIENVVRINEIYKYADKVVRVARINELSDLYYSSIKNEFSISDGKVTSEINVQTNTLLRLFDRMKVEVGDPSVNGMLRRNNRNKEKHADNSEFEDISLDKNDVSQLLEKRYANQLPSSIEKKIDFTDYNHCANGEKSGEMVCCWHKGITKGNTGSQCKVQSGEIQKCPKFLNSSLLDNIEWLRTQRERKQSVEDLAFMVGCTEYDPEIRDIIADKLKDSGIFAISRNNEKEETAHTTNVQP